MGRHKNTHPVIDTANTDINKEAVSGAMDAMRTQELAVIEADKQAAVRARAMAETLGYVLPADTTDPELIQRDIAANMRRTVESMIEVGRGLLVLKEACPYGEFQKRLEVLGFEQRAARRYMQVVARFAKRSTSTVLLEAAGTQSKLLEMLVLDDDQIEELELTGQTGELSLDGVATMSVKELRAAVRDLRAEREADEQVRGDLRKKIDRLEREKKRIKTEEPDAVLADLAKEAQGHAANALGLIRGHVRASLQALASHHIEHGGDSALITMAGMVGQLQAELNALRAEFNLPDLSAAQEAQLASEVAQWAGAPATH